MCCVELANARFQIIWAQRCKGSRSSLHAFSSFLAQSACCRGLGFSTIVGIGVILMILARIALGRGLCTNLLMDLCRWASAGALRANRLPAPAVFFLCACLFPTGWLFPILFLLRHCGSLPHCRIHTMLHIFLRSVSSACVEYRAVSQHNLLNPYFWGAALSRKTTDRDDIAGLQCILVPTRSG